MSSELPDPIRQLAQRMKQIETEKTHTPSMYQPHCPGITLSYPGNASYRPAHPMLGGALREERGRAAEYREKYNVHSLRPGGAQIYNDLSAVIHDDNDSHSSVYSNIDFDRIRRYADIRDYTNPSGNHNPWMGTDRHGNKVKWYYRDSRGRKIRSREGEPIS